MPPAPPTQRSRLTLLLPPFLPAVARAGNHKLGPYGFPIHGGIDGHSRFVLCLQVSSDNWSDTVLMLYKEAARRYGIPRRLRVDKGGENYGMVAWQPYQVQLDQDEERF